MTHTITPWEVKGTIDYNRLIKDFGLQPFPLLNTLPLEFTKFPLFRRGIIFAHRDISRITDAIKQKKKFVMMTGLMPSGKFHFYFQSKRSQDGNQSNAYYTLANMLARHVTFNEMQAIYGELSPGKMSSALLQASDMLHPQLQEFEGSPLPIIVPVGADQDPHLRLARDVSQRIKEFKFIQLSSTYHKFMPGLDGGKMSSSNENSYIALTDTPEDAARKIKKYAFSGGQATLEEHRRLGGNPDIDVAFQMLRYGLEPDDKNLQKIYDNYKSGKLLSGELKQILIDKITLFLKDHHEKRKKAAKEVEKILKEKEI